MTDVFYILLSLFLCIMIVQIVRIIIRHKNGWYSYDEKILESGNQYRKDTVVGKFYIIQRTYKNGKIEIRIEET